MPTPSRKPQATKRATSSIGKEDDVDEGKPDDAEKTVHEYGLWVNANELNHMVSGEQTVLLCPCMPKKIRKNSTVYILGSHTLLHDSDEAKEVDGLPDMDSECQSHATAFGTAVYIGYSRKDLAQIELPMDGLSCYDSAYLKDKMAADSWTSTKSCFLLKLSGFRKLDVDQVVILKKSASDNV